MNLTEYAIDIENTTRDNENYRWVFQTSKQQQLVFMSLLPNEEIGEEVHPRVTQFIRIEKGTGTAIVGKKTYHLDSKTSIFIPAGTKHNVINTGAGKLKLYAIYSPPNHPVGTLQRFKPKND